MLVAGNLVGFYILYGFQNSHKQLFHHRIILGKISKIFRCKGATMPGLTFMVKDKEGKSNAHMVKIKKKVTRREKYVKRQFLCQYQKGYVDLCILNNSLNNF
jgi:hypothetical protein